MNLKDVLDKINANGSRKCAIVEAIRDIAPVIRYTPLHIVVHAQSRPERTVAPPALGIVKIVRISLWRCHLLAIEERRPKCIGIFAVELCVINDFPT